MKYIFSSQPVITCPVPSATSGGSGIGVNPANGQDRQYNNGGSLRNN